VVTDMEITKAVMNMEKLVLDIENQDCVSKDDVAKLKQTIRDVLRNNFESDYYARKKICK